MMNGRLFGYFYTSIYYASVLSLLMESTDSMIRENVWAADIMYGWTIIGFQSVLWKCWFSIGTMEMLVFNWYYGNVGFLSACTR